MSKLAPSVLAADFKRLGEQIREIEEMKVEVLHIDVMDGMFVPSISFGMPVIASLRQGTELFFDVHLMVQEPIRYLQEFREAGADSITVHAEACRDLEKTLRRIREVGCRVGVSVCPETPIEEILPVLDQVDIVLVMSVHPGFGGQKLIPETLEKVRQLKTLRTEKGFRYAIEIDGGVNYDNIGEIAGCGTDVIVAGTAVFEGDIISNIQRLKEVLEHAS